MDGDLFSAAFGGGPNGAQHDQKGAFQAIRNFVAGRALGATRDDALLDEVLKCMFIRKHMLLNGGPPRMRDPAEIARSYRNYLPKVRKLLKTIEDIKLDIDAIAFVDLKLSSVDLLNPLADPVGDLYETFIGASIRGADGQFFTPQNAGSWLVEAVAPQSGEMVIDPACGAGGFLLWAAQATNAGARLYGIEKDEFLATLARSRTRLIGGAATIYCANALSFEGSKGVFDPMDLIGSFDVVLTNPPFGKNIVSVSPAIQREFDLGWKWKRTGERLEKTGVLATKAPPQLLFLERVITLLKNGGRAGVVVPESLISSRSYAHVVQYLRDHSSVKAVVGMPEALFKSSGKGGTHTKTALLVFEKGTKQNSIYMAEAKWCGNDSRGRRIEHDDIPKIGTGYKAFRGRREIGFGYRVKPSEVHNNVLAPRYYEPSAALATQHLAKTHKLSKVSDLVEQGIIEVSSGDEVGKLAYGTGSVPFIRTSDISGWEIKIDPKHCISDELYQKLRGRQDVRRGDILMVRDGTYLIGSCAFVTEYDERMVYQSHILKIRCLKPKVLDPYLLLAVFSSEPVQKQIKAKTFTQDIIDSLGSRFGDLLLPLPKKKALQVEVTDLVRKVIADRVEARELSRKAKLLVAPSAT